MRRRSRGWSRRGGGRVVGLAALGLTAGSVVDPDTLRNLFTKRLHPVTGEVLGRTPHEFAKLEEEIAAQVEAAMAEEPEEMQTPERRRELTFMIRAEAGREHVNFYDVGFSVPKSPSLLQVGWIAAAEEAQAAGDLDRAAECEAKAEEIEQVVFSRPAASCAWPNSTCTCVPGITAHRRGSGATALGCLQRSSCITRRGPLKGRRPATRSCTRTSRSGRTRSAGTVQTAPTGALTRRACIRCSPTTPRSANWSWSSGCSGSAMRSSGPPTVTSR